MHVSQLYDTKGPICPEFERVNSRGQDKQGQHNFEHRAGPATTSMVLSVALAHISLKLCGSVHAQQISERNQAVQARTNASQNKFASFLGFSKELAVWNKPPS